MSLPFKIISIFLITFLVGGGLYLAIFSPIDTYKTAHNSIGFKATVEEDSITLRQGTKTLYVTYVDANGATLYRQRVISGDENYKQGQQITIYKRSNGTLVISSLSVKSILIGAIMVLAGVALTIVLIKNLKSPAIS